MHSVATAKCYSQFKPLENDTSRIWRICVTGWPHGFQLTRNVWIYTYIVCDAVTLIQILCFWTLSIVLFLFKTPSCNLNRTPPTENTVNPPKSLIDHPISQTSLDTSPTWTPTVTAEVENDNSVQCIFFPSSSLPNFGACSRFWSIGLSFLSFLIRDNR
jgi:hypothetical protein